MLGLERVQYRALMIALDLMGSIDFYRLGHPLRKRLECYQLSLDMVPSESYTRHELPALLGTPLVDEQIE
jgi:hypothetical protein